MLVGARAEQAGAGVEPGAGPGLNQLLQSLFCAPAWENPRAKVLSQPEKQNETKQKLENQNPADLEGNSEGKVNLRAACWPWESTARSH